MTVADLKRKVEAKALPQKMIWVNQNHTLVEHYLDHISLIYNRKFKKIFNLDELSDLFIKMEANNTIYLVYPARKDVERAIKAIDGVMAIIMVDEEVTNSLGLETVSFGKISRNACIVFIEDYVKMNKSKKDREEGKHHLSREVIENLVDCYEDDLDMCMNEIKKVEILDLNGSWDKPMLAILESLPKRDKKLRSLKWFSGGDMDTCQVLYNIYSKKIRELATLTHTGKMPPTKTLECWLRLVREAIWCEACILEGCIGDYVVDYLKLVESSLPSDFKVQYFPPVFYKDLEEFPEWTVFDNKGE